MGVQLACEIDEGEHTRGLALRGQREQRSRSEWPHAMRRPASTTTVSVVGALNEWEPQVEEPA